MDAQGENFEKSLNVITMQTIGSLNHCTPNAWDADFVGLPFLNESYSIVAGTAIITVGSSYPFIMIHYFSSLDFNDEFGWFKKELSCYLLKCRSVARYFRHSFVELTQIKFFYCSEIQIAPYFIQKFLLTNYFAYLYHLNHLFKPIVTHFIILQTLKIQQCHHW